MIGRGLWRFFRYWLIPFNPGKLMFMSPAEGGSGLVLAWELQSAGDWVGFGRLKRGAVIALEVEVTVLKRKLKEHGIE
jgi:hypothetical protein